jgi:hypothetical protein
MMTKKDYQLIAKVLGAFNTDGVEALLSWSANCRFMARELAKENPRFDTVTFLDTCGFDMAFGKSWRTDYAA